MIDLWLAPVITVIVAEIIVMAYMASPNPGTTTPQVASIRVRMVYLPGTVRAQPGISRPPTRDTPISPEPRESACVPAGQPAIDHPPPNTTADARDLAAGCRTCGGRVEIGPRTGHHASGR